MKFFVNLPIDVQDRVNDPLLFLNGYTNGCAGYLPSRTEWYKGGYEVLFSYFVYHKYLGRVMPYKAETANRIVNLVADEWEQIKNNSV